MRTSLLCLLTPLCLWLASSRLLAQRSPTDQGAGEVVMRLRNTLTRDLDEVFRQFTAQELTPGGRIRGAQPWQWKPFRITPVRSTNSLIVRASGKRMTQLRRMVAELDERMWEVLVEILVVDVSDDELARLRIPPPKPGWLRPGFGGMFSAFEFVDKDDDGLPDTRLPSFDHPRLTARGCVEAADHGVLDGVLGSVGNPRIVRLSPSIALDRRTAFAGFRRERGGGLDVFMTPLLARDGAVQLEMEFVLEFGPEHSALDREQPQRHFGTLFRMLPGSTMVLAASEDDKALEACLRDTLWKNATGRPCIFVTAHILDEHDFADISPAIAKRNFEAKGNGLAAAVQAEFPIYRRPQRVQ